MTSKGKLINQNQQEEIHPQCLNLTMQHDFELLYFHYPYLMEKLNEWLICFSAIFPFALL